MNAGASELRHLIEAGHRFALWFGSEFLVIPMRLGIVPILTGFCRLSGCAAIVVLVFVQLRGGIVDNLGTAIAQCTLSGLIALLLGRIVSELTFVNCIRLANWLGIDFKRRGRTLDGKTYREHYYADGTWMRCESGRAGTVCEWTDSLGQCHRIESAPARARRPPEPGRSVRPR